jgi:hypothetical protein
LGLSIPHIIEPRCRSNRPAKENRRKLVVTWTGKMNNMMDDNDDMHGMDEFDQSEFEVDDDDDDRKPHSHVTCLT